MILINGFPVEVTKFPDGTSQVWKVPESNMFAEIADCITWKFEHEGEIMHLAQLRDLITLRKKTWPKLYMPFLPYGRQDKKISNDATFAKSSFLSIIQSLMFNEVTTLDAHSESYRIKSLSPKTYIQNAIKKVRPTVIVFPDKGAKIRYEAMVSCYPTVVFDKIRDQSTGEITGLTVDDNSLLNNNDTVLIIDDICDGGRTFIEVSKYILKEHPLVKINLYTTHGIYSKGTQVLKEAGIKQIFNYQGEV